MAIGRPRKREYGPSCSLNLRNEAEIIEGSHAFQRFYRLESTLEFGGCRVTPKR